MADGDTVYTPDMVLGPDRKGLKFCYCTDSRPTDAITRNVMGADLFICEGMYGEPDKDEQAREKKHMTFTEAAKLAAAAEPNPKEMWLTHYSPSLVNPAEYVGRIRSIFPNVIATKDLRTTTLKFIDEE